MTSATAEPETPPVIVIGLDSATGLQVARIFARRSIPVVGIVHDRRHWAARTRAASSVVELDHGSPGLAEALVEDDRFASGSVLLPCTDQSVRTVAARADVLRSRFRFADPGSDVIEMLLDKAAFAEVAEASGAPTARWAEVRTADDIADAVRHVAVPCVVKPSRKDERWLSSAPEKAIRVNDAAQLELLLRRALDWSDHLVVQEWVDGPHTSLVTCNCYVDPQGEVLASVVTAKLRQWPPETGTGSAAVTVDAPDVAAVTARMLTSQDFVGLGYVEFKRRSTGELVAIEANVGRPTGRSSMAEAAGVELLATYYADLVGRPRPALREPEIGVVWLHVRRDLQAAVRSWRRHESTPREWLQSVRGRRCYAVASWSDPVPFALDLLVTLRKPVRALIRRRRHAP